MDSGQRATIGKNWLARRNGGHAITLQVKRAAPDLQSEIDTIDRFERDVEKKPTADWRRDQDRGYMRNVLRLIWFNWDVFTDRPLSLTEGIAVQHARPQDHVDKCWEWTVGKILTNSAEAYADISSLGEILRV